MRSRFASEETEIFPTLLVTDKCKSLQICGFCGTVLRRKASISGSITCPQDNRADCRAVLRNFGLTCQEKRAEIVRTKALIRKDKSTY